MGLADRDYMRERSHKRAGRRLKKLDASTAKVVDGTGRRLKGLDEHPAISPLSMRFWGSRPKYKATKKRPVVGALGALIPIAFFVFAADHLLVPTPAEVESEQARREKAIVAAREAPREPGRRQTQPGIKGIEGRPAAPKASPRKAPTRYVTADELPSWNQPAPGMRTVSFTGNGIIHLVDLTGSSDYKVLQLRSLSNKKLVGTAIVKPGEDLRIKVPYRHPFRVTAITSPIMPKSLDGLKTSTVTVDLGTVSAMPNRPGVIAMGAPGQAMRVIADSQF